jgi:hypothetical protein
MSPLDVLSKLAFFHTMAPGVRPSRVNRARKSSSNQVRMPIDVKGTSHVKTLKPRARTALADRTNQEMQDRIAGM